MLTLALTLALAAGDAGVASPLQPLLGQLMEARLAASAERRAEFVAAVKAAKEHATPEEQAFLERLVRLMDLEPDPKTTFQALVSLTREALLLERGDFAAERSLTATFLSFPFSARSFSLDPAPLTQEAVSHARALVKRWPREASAHGVLASALELEPAPPKDVLAALERCVALDGARATKCGERRDRLIAELERPRCSGAALSAPLTFSGAQEAWKLAPGTPLTVDGVELTVEPKPFLDGAQLAALSVDDEGNLRLEATKAGAIELAQHTRRLRDTRAGYVVVRLGDEVLMAPRLMDAIEGGQVRITRGRDRAPFSLEALCKTVERPRVRR